MHSINPIWIVITTEKVINASPASKSKQTAVQGQDNVVDSQFAAFK